MVNIGIIDDIKYIDRLEDEAWVGLVRTYAFLRERLGRALRTDWGLSVTEFQVLALLAECPTLEPVTTTDLAREVTLSVSGLSRLIDRLVARKLVSKEPNGESDARTFSIAITAVGADLYCAAAQSHRALVRQLFFDKLTPSELRVVARVCTCVCGQRRC